MYLRKFGKTQCSVPGRLNVVGNIYGRVEWRFIALGVWGLPSPGHIHDRCIGEFWLWCTVTG